MPEYLDGPGFCAWLEQVGFVLNEATLSSYVRAVRRWRSGQTASVWVADEVLTRLGAHLSEIPDDLWRESPTKGNGGSKKHPKISPRVKAAALTAVARGGTISVVAARFAINHATLRSWMREAGLFPAGADPGEKRDRRKKVAA